jgi:hypothetical protein
VSADAAAAAYPMAWWSHALLALWFVAWIPYAKPFHMLSSFANIVTRDENAGRRLPGVPLDPAEAESLDDVDDFSWKQLLDQDACTKCGRCSSVCPVKISGRPLNPRDVILDLKSYRQERDASGETTPTVTDGGTSVTDAETMESCLACMAWMDTCPVEIEQLTDFTDMNRQLTEQGEVDSNVQDVYGNVTQQGNIFSNSAQQRTDWTDDLDFEIPDAREESAEYPWYVGTTPVTTTGYRRSCALARLFNKAGVDDGLLYESEVDDGLLYESEVDGRRRRHPLQVGSRRRPPLQVGGRRRQRHPPAGRGTPLRRAGLDARRRLQAV